MSGTFMGKKIGKDRNNDYFKREKTAFRRKKNNKGLIITSELKLALFSPKSGLAPVEYIGNLGGDWTCEKLEALDKKQRDEYYIVFAENWMKIADEALSKLVPKVLREARGITKKATQEVRKEGLQEQEYLNKKIEYIKDEFESLKAKLDTRFIDLQKSCVKNAHIKTYKSAGKPYADKMFDYKFRGTIVHSIVKLGAIGGAVAGLAAMPGMGTGLVIAGSVILGTRALGIMSSTTNELTKQTHNYLEARQISSKLCGEALGSVTSAKEAMRKTLNKNTSLLVMADSLEENIREAEKKLQNLQGAPDAKERKKIEEMRSRCKKSRELLDKYEKTFEQAPASEILTMLEDAEAKFKAAQAKVKEHTTYIQQVADMAQNAADTVGEIVEMVG